MPLRRRMIGNSAVPVIGFGTGGLGVAGYGALEPFEERLKMFDHAYERGCTHWDTADVYGESEALIGEWFRRTRKRDEIFLSTKIGFTANGPCGDPEYVKQAVERSLKTLGTGHIDLLYLHRVDPKTPIERSVKAMVDVVRQGKIKYLGLSDPSVNSLRRAHAVHPISAIQIEFSPLILDATKPPHNLIEVAKELGIAVVVYSPLARGLITGRFTSPDQFDPTDYRRGIPRFSTQNFPKILKAVSEIEAIGRKHEATAAQVTLAWILAQGDGFFVIPGCKNVKRLEENVGCARVELSREDVEQMWNIARTADEGVTGAKDNLHSPTRDTSFVDSPPLTAVLE